MFYLPNTPLWLRMIFPPGVTWKGDPKNNTVYLTFDDGPEPEVTQYVLDLLNQYDIKATFFCIGENVAKHPGMFQKLQNSGHRVGNHTMHHPNGWQTENSAYFKEVLNADKLIGSKLFRPPYGKITYKQARVLKSRELLEKELVKQGEKPAAQKPHPFKIIMWSVIAGDFDEKIDGNTCFKHIVKYTKPGSIIVFHDSLRAYPRLKVALPKTLEWLQQQGFRAALLQ